MFLLFSSFLLKKKGSERKLWKNLRFFSV